jgi:uncharacterized membrane protein
MALEDLAFARAIHVLAVVVWIGGVAMVTTVLLPAIRSLPLSENPVAFFERVERRFAFQARILTLLAGLSGFYMLYRMDAWSRYLSATNWWLHAMTLVWLIFTIILFVLEPLVLYDKLAKRAEKDPRGTLVLIQRAHWGLLALSIIALAGAVAGCGLFGCATRIMMPSPAGLVWAGSLLWTALALPPIRQALQGTMTSQMLVQIPLLALAGWLVARAMPHRIAALARWDYQGIGGLLLASLTGMVWMLPRMMDASVDDAWFTLAKFASVPLLIGAPVALSWPQAGFVVRGVFLLELIATAFRLGWLYLVSPMRLCSNYLLSDQQRLGKYLLVIGAAGCLVLAWKLIGGRIRIEPQSTDR